MSHTSEFLAETARICELIDSAEVEEICSHLVALRERGGRLFILGVGGSAANCSHAVNDFRKLCGIETYAPTDNVSELTARINDDGWDGVFAAWLKASRANGKDAILVFSVGGGDAEKKVSVNLVVAIDYAKSLGMTVLGVVGRAGGHTKAAGDAVVVIPTVAASRVTPHAEAFQAVIWHSLVSHPALQIQQTKW
ncbi:SIS domain-containing protein [Azospirillum sp. B2RO_4]|uniref:SIS domain-containing protein n=1 Tax=Azospirillum sp. B2RO_4 TaxID=3027796 RepID=UPI003DA8F63D